MKDFEPNLISAHNNHPEEESPQTSLTDEQILASLSKLDAMKVANSEDLLASRIKTLTSKNIAAIDLVLQDGVAGDPYRLARVEAPLDLSELLR
jgi:hypothetical protein